MLHMVKGCNPPFPEKLVESYEMHNGVITANLHAEKIEPFFLHFLALHTGEPLFFALELPANIKDEAVTKEGRVDCFHNDLYLIDVCDGETAVSILDDYGELLLNDGVSRFGFGAPRRREEMLLDKYNILRIFSPTPENYSDFFASHGVPRVGRLYTAWDSISEDSPGRCERYETGGITVFSLPSLLRDRGIFFAGKQEEE